MNDDLHLLDDVMELLEGKAIRTSAGSFYKEEDVRRLIEKKKAANAIDKAAEDPPKSLVEARRKAGEFLKESIGPQKTREPGRSVSATEAQSSSRT